MLKPRIEIFHRNKLLNSLSLSRKYNKFTYGHHPNCHLTNIDPGTPRKMVIVHWRRQYIQFNIESTWNFHLYVDGNLLDFKKVQSLGLTRRTLIGHQIRLPLDKDLVAEVSLKDRLVRVSCINIASELMNKTNLMHIGANILSADWRFITIFIITMLTSLRFANFLYGLPEPPPNELALQRLQTKQIRVIIPNQPQPTVDSKHAAFGKIKTTSKLKSLVKPKTQKENRLENLLASVDYKSRVRKTRQTKE